MEQIITTIINGLSLGGVYALIALGYTMVYGIAKMLNFAHGDIIMVGSYTIFVFMNATGHPIIAAIFAAVICVLLGTVMERLAYKPLRGASPLAVLITAIGVSYLLQSLSQIIFGPTPKTVIVADLGVTKFGDKIAISNSSIMTLILTVVIMIALTLFIKFSKTGRAMLAVSEDRDAAKVMGVNVNAIITVTFSIGAFLAAVASLFYLLKYPSISNTMGSMPGIKAFTAAVIGGIGSIPGAMLGGILLGVIECIFNSFPSIAPYTDAVEFGILIVLLLIRPNGILGKKKREKV
ncbi:MAG: branched-chain amino acid ABC transporter permease [Clostridia bacterium]|nr:branched-chain amino acid ABC transporter permease [Clostridia bacterium]